MGWFHSKIAKWNMRRQVNGWIKKLNKGIKGREKELAFYRKIAPLTPSDWDDNIIPELEKELRIHREKLKYYEFVKRKYETEGLI